MTSLRKHDGPEDPVEKDLEIVAGRRVAVEIEAPGRLEDAAKLDEPRRHHAEIGHDVALAEDGPEGTRRRGRGPADALDLGVRGLRLVGPIATYP